MTLPAVCSAAIVVVLPTATEDGSLTFTEDITYQITTSGGLSGIFFDEWVTDDGEIDAIMLAGTVNVVNNGVPGTISGPMVLIDNLSTGAANPGDITPNDGSIRFMEMVSVTEGTSFTVLAQSIVLPAGSLPPDYNPGVSQTFTGGTYLADSDGNIISGVPEPSGVLLTGLGASLMLLRRRRLE